MKKLTLLFALTGVVWGQCGKMSVNAVTGKLDCTGALGDGPSWDQEIGIPASNGTWCVQTSSGVSSWVSCPGSGGGISSIGLTLPSYYTASPNPLVANGTITISPTAGQTANLFLATPNGATGAVGLRSIALADLPTGYLYSNLGSVPTTFNAGSILGSSIPSLTSGHLQYNGSALVWDPATYLTANQTVTVSGDCTGSGATSISLTCTQINGSNFTVNSSGIPTKIDGITTNGVGVALVLGKSALTAQTASLGSTTIATAPGAGDYYIHWYSDVNTACTTGGNSVSFTFNWTDASNARALATGGMSMATQGTAGYASGMIPIHIGSGNVTYTSTVAGSCATGTSSYDINVWMEKVN